MVAEAPVGPQDAAEDVIVDRLKLPAQAATVKLENFLVDDDAREGYLRPSTRSTDGAAPFDGRACERVQPKEFRVFLRALDQCSMFAAMRTALGRRSGFFCVRETTSP